MHFQKNDFLAGTMPPTIRLGSATSTTFLENLKMDAYKDFFYLVCAELHTANENPKGEKLSKAIKNAMKKCKDKKVIEAVKERTDRTVSNDMRNELKKLSATAEYKELIYLYTNGNATAPNTHHYWVVLKIPERRETPKTPIPTVAERALTVALKHAKFFLPKDERDELSKLSEGNKTIEAWLTKIDVVPRYITLIPNHENNEDFRKHEELIMKALANEEGFKASYSNQTEATTFFPYKLVRREQLSYVYCYTPHNDKSREYAISRFNKIDSTLVARGITVPPQESLIKKAVEPKIQGHWGLLDELIIRIEGGPAQHFMEMRFHKDPKDAKLTEIVKFSFQNEDRSKDFVEIKIRNIQYSYEFKCWLLGLGHQVKIIDFKTKIKKVNPIRDLKEEAETILGFYKATE